MEDAAQWPDVRQSRSHERCRLSLTMDDRARLCESCGYVLDGLPLADGAVCPECGTAVPGSRDARRPGTTWQRSRGGVPAWLTTSWQVCRHPSRVFDEMQVEWTTASRLLGRWNVVISAVLMSLSWLLMEGVRYFTSHLGRFALFLAATVSAIMLLLAALTAIEARGIRFFGARRGWRVTPVVAGAICAHASIGWVIGGVLMLFVSATGIALSMPLERLARFLPFPTWVPILILAFFLGLLIFETLVYVGVRQCRYANMPDGAVRKPGA
jgi:predicted RNA-binding Zn-ribbon protein involved in translation (DUF1610 family)